MGPVFISNMLLLPMSIVYGFWQGFGLCEHIDVCFLFFFSVLGGQKLVSSSEVSNMEVRDTTPVRRTQCLRI